MNTGELKVYILTGIIALSSFLVVTLTTLILIAPMFQPSPSTLSNSEIETGSNSSIPILNSIYLAMDSTKSKIISAKEYFDEGFEYFDMTMGGFVTMVSAALFIGLILGFVMRIKAEDKEASERKAKQLELEKLERKRLKKEEKLREQKKKGRSSRWRR